MVINRGRVEYNQQEEIELRRTDKDETTIELPENISVNAKIEPGRVKLMRVFKLKLDLDMQWSKIMTDYFSTPKGQNIANYLSSYTSVDIYPEAKNIFNAFKYCKWHSLKMVILGDYPHVGYQHVVQYNKNSVHNPKIKVADGLSYSSQIDWWNGIPKNLQNIVDEIDEDIHMVKEKSRHLGLQSDRLEFNDLNNAGFSLEYLARQGVLLLNESLTTSSDRNQHQYLWADFFKYIVDKIKSDKKDIVYITMGENWITQETVGFHNFIVQTSKPSMDEFRGCKCFSTANGILRRQGIVEIKF